MSQHFRSINTFALPAKSAPGVMASPRHPQPATAAVSVRPCVRGKFISAAGEKLYIRGVTYGTFRPSEDGSQYPDTETVKKDFARMAANGLNAVRTYTVPPRWLLDEAALYGLRVLVGTPWEQHVTFLDDKRRARSIMQRVRRGVRSCAGHPAVLGYAVGNEIPAPIVRWHGRGRVERFIKQLYRAAKDEDPDGLITYVNYPSTEYLELPFLDLVCFNVYLESQERFGAYITRLQNLAGDRPLIMAEVGLDSRRHGDHIQAHALDWQIRTAFAAGCAGAFVFAWTDEWHRGGYEIEEWDFGLTDRGRRPKPALAAVRRALAEVPFPPGVDWPRISVIVCTYNGERKIRDCFEGLLRLEYPNFEVIVVDDGSTDATSTIAREYNFRVIRTENRGLSSARNTGLEASTGEIVAYIDDDAYPDPHWLTYLAATFLGTGHAAAGGPNIAPAGDGPVAECVANAPGGPTHVLLSDREAEHIPGCNMAFRKACLQAIGGFDPQFRVAGDDVDVCWRIQRQGWTIGFSPAAVVWHHRRNSVRAYWKQQKGYGKAEALLEKKWPEKYNAPGHHSWTGRVYGNGLTRAPGWRRGRIYQGVWGSALFQSVYQPAPGMIGSLCTMPEWYLAIIALAMLSALGTLWTPLLLALPLFVSAAVASVAGACRGAAQASFTSAQRSYVARLKLRGLTALLHLLQPAARLCGRLRHGLTPWRRRALRGFSPPWPRTFAIWSERWQSATERLESLEAYLRARHALVARGGEFDRWDLEVCGGMLGTVRVRMATEEHGAGRQLTRLRLWPRCSAGVIVLILLLVSSSIMAGFGQLWTPCMALGSAALLLAARAFHECAAAMAASIRSLSVIKISHPLRQQPAGKPKPLDLPARGNGHSGQAPHHAGAQTNYVDSIKGEPRNGQPEVGIQSVFAKSGSD